MYAAQKFFGSETIKELSSKMETNADTAEIVMLVDVSGSMWDGLDDSQGGINAFIKDQQSHDGDARFTLVEFNTSVKISYHGDIKEYGQYVLDPGGGTALNDAVGQSIDLVGKLLSEADEQKRPKLVTFVIVTDGGENSSTEFKTDQVKDMIKHQSDKYNWNFIFLGADYDAVSDCGYASGMGMAANYSKGNAKNFYSGLSNKIKQARSASASGQSAIEVGASLNFSEEERTEFNS